MSLGFRVISLSSAHNPLIQDVRRAAMTGRATEEGLFVAEGPHLVEELLRGTWRIEKILFTNGTFPAWEHRARKLGVESIVLSEKAFRSMSGTETPQGVVALARPVAWAWGDLLSGRPLLAVMDGVQDPGNAGTILRSAEAFGATGAVFLENSVRPSNPKLMRASAGSLFRIPFLHGITANKLQSELENRGVRMHALVPSSPHSLSESDFTRPSALIAGSEGSGVSSALLAAADPVSIPTSAVESLNVAVACSIALYEASRQRSRQ